MMQAGNLAQHPAISRMSDGPLRSRCSAATAYESLGLYAQAESGRKSPDRERRRWRRGVASWTRNSGRGVAQCPALSHPHHETNEADNDLEGTIHLADGWKHHVVEQ